MLYDVYITLQNRGKPVGYVKTFLEPTPYITIVNRALLK